MISHKYLEKCIFQDILELTANVPLINFLTLGCGRWWITIMYTNLSEKAMAPHSSTLAWKIPWMEEPGRLQSMGSLRVRHDWTTSLSFFTFMHWRRKWQPTPVFLPGESQGQGSLVGCHLWGRIESNTKEQLNWTLKVVKNFIWEQIWQSLNHLSYSQRKNNWLDPRPDMVQYASCVIKFLDGNLYIIGVVWAPCQTKTCYCQPTSTADINTKDPLQRARNFRGKKRYHSL